MAVSLNGDGTITGLSTLDSVTITGLTSLTTTDLTADTTTLVVDSANNRVGIGTSSPMVALNIHDSTNARLALTNSSTGQTFPDGFELLATGLDAYIMNRSNGNLIFTTNNTDRMRITSTGNVGIGTSSPTTTLDVETTIRSKANAATNDSTVGKVSFYNTNASASANPERAYIEAGRQNSAWGAYLKFATSTGTSAATEAMRIDSSGNVGIGTSSPTSKLQVNGASLLGSPATFYVGDDGGSLGAFLNQTAALPIRFNTSGAERMRIDSSGNVLMGTTTASGTSILTLQKSVSSAGSGGGKLVNIYNPSATNTTKGYNNLLRIASQGTGADCHIALTDNTDYNYSFGGNNGGLYCQSTTNGVRLGYGATSWASDSDERVKDIIEPIENAAEKVSTLRSVIGKYKTDVEGTRRSFLIAQDVQAVLPEAVFEEQGTLMLQYTDVIPLLVAAIKEQQTIIKALETRIQTLEAK